MKNKVLLIDDSVTIHRVIDLSIDFDKFEIVKVFSSEDASIKMNEDQYDYILLDNKLEGVNVPEYITEIKAVQNECKIILLVGAFDRFSEEDLQNSGADDFLVKPFDSQSLDTKLNGESSTEGREADVYGGELEQNQDTFTTVPDDEADEDIMKTDFIERMPEADKNREHSIDEPPAPEPLTGAMPGEILPRASVPAGGEYLKTLDEIHEDNESEDDPFGELKEAADFDSEDEEQKAPTVEEKLTEPVAVEREDVPELIEESISEPVEESVTAEASSLTALLEERSMVDQNNTTPADEDDDFSGLSSAPDEDEMPVTQETVSEKPADEVSQEPVRVLEEEPTPETLPIPELITEQEEPSLEDGLSEPIQEPIEELVTESAPETLTETEEPSLEDALSEPIQEPIEELVTESAPETLTETEEPLLEEALSEPIQEPIEELVTESAPETLTEQEEPSLEEALSEPIQEPMEELVTESAPETLTETEEPSLEEALSEPIQEPIEELVTESVSETLTETEEPSLEDALSEPIQELVTESVPETLTEQEVIPVQDLDEPIAIPLEAKEKALLPESVIEPIVETAPIQVPVQSPVPMPTAPVNHGGITISISHEEIRSMIGQAIDKRVLEAALKEVLAKNMEEIVRTIVPTMAEKYIKAEIERLKNDE